MEYDAELLGEFKAEAKEHLDSIESDFLALGNKAAPPDRAMVDKVFRAIHSIKGSAGFLDLIKIKDLAHVMEALLVLVRSDKLKPGQAHIDALLEGVDHLNHMLDDMAASNNHDMQATHNKLTRLLEEAAATPAQGARRPAPVVAPPPVVRPGPTSDVPLLDFDLSGVEWRQIPPEFSRLYQLRYDLTAMNTGARITPLALLRQLYDKGYIVEARAHVAARDLNARLGELPLWCDVLYATTLDAAQVKAHTAWPPVAVAELGWPSKPPVIDLGPPPAAPAVAPEAPSEIPVSQEMYQRFALESGELLDAAEDGLLRLLKEPAQRSDICQETFRCVHSFKGNCGFFGLPDFEKVSHAAETIMDGLRNGSLACSESVVSTLLAVIDYLRAGLARGGQDHLPELTERDAWIARLEQLGQPDAAAVAAPPPVPEAAPVAAPVPAPVAEPAAELQESARPASAAAAPQAARQDIRVDLQKLDRLINLVGELVIAEAMVVRHPVVMRADDEHLERAIHHLGRISSDLQDIAMSVRMIPLAGTFRKMKRLVHDVSAKAGKQVELVLLGEETEMDKTVIEQINDPLVHIVRNSIDHGMESSADRAAAGKPAAGTVTIQARHQGGEVWLSIADDGRGLSREKILAKAIQKGLVKGDGSGLSDDDVYRIIFEPGFSTAAVVTDISGRGVGMDVVRKNIEKLSGRVEVRTQPGQGTTVILRIPLTLAIIDGMLVRVGQAQYTIPLLAIRESLRPESRHITQLPDGVEIVRVREEMVPVLRLHHLFEQTADCARLEEGLLIIIEADGEPAALLVDEIVGQQQAVIKGLSAYLGKARGVSGCTILGNGEVSLILDVASLIKMAQQKTAAAAAARGD